MRIVPEKHPELEAETSLDDDVAHPEDREKIADRARMFVKNKDVKYVKCKSVCKKPSESFVFKKHCDWIIFFQVPQFE